MLAVGAARRARHPEHLDPSATGRPALGAVLGTCLALTFLNPHVYLDTVVLLGSLAHQHDPGAWAFAVGAACASVVWFTALGLRRGATCGPCSPGPAPGRCSTSSSPS